jgi:rsbT antagonist protein RsbS
MKIPILRLGRILLASIQVELSDSDAMLFQQEMVRRIAEIEALGIAIDITSLDVVDSYMARMLNDTARMARLLGAEVVISGIRPFVAMTLVEMGRGLLDADCVFDLEQALIKLNQRIALRGDSKLDEEE